MKKKFLNILICFMQLSLTLFAESGDWIDISKYDKPAYMVLSTHKNYDLFRFSIAGLRTDEMSRFDLGNSGLSDEEAAQLLKQVRMETYDIGEVLSHDTAAAYMNSCLLSLLIKKYGYSYVSQVNYEFELQDIIEGDDSFTFYIYYLKVR